MMDLSIICPAFQDEENIGKVVSRALSALPKVVNRLEVIVVDDGSRDGTSPRVHEAAQGDERVRLIRHTHNLGYGQAIRTGLAAACRWDLIGLTDGDGQYDVAEIADMLPLIGSFDVITGARRQNRNPLYRRLMSHRFNELIRSLFKVPFRDLTSSLKLFRREACLDDRLVSRGNFTDVELVLRAYHSGYRIEEVSIEHYPREYGKSHSMSIARIIETFMELRRVYRSLHVRA